MDFPSLQSFEGLIRFISFRYTRDWMEQDDLSQELRMKYIECMEKCQVLGLYGISFSKYYKTAIWNYAQNYGKKKKKQKEINFERLDDIALEINAEIDFDPAPESENLYRFILHEYESGKLLEQICESGLHVSKNSISDILVQKVGVSKNRIKRTVAEIRKENLLQASFAKDFGKEEKILCNASYRLAKAEAFREYRKKYREANRETISRYQKEYRSINQEDLKQYAKNYYQQHRSSILSYQQEYREGNKESKKKSQNKYYLANKDRIKERQKNYREQNREKKKRMNREYYLANAGKIREKRVSRYRESVSLNLNSVGAN